MTLRRRDLLASAGSAMLASILLPIREAAAATPRLRITGVELRPVRAMRAAVGPAVHDRLSQFLRRRAISRSGGNASSFSTARSVGDLTRSSRQSDS